MGREQIYKNDIGKSAMVYMGNGIDSVSGTLSIVTRDEIVLDVYDSLGTYSGIRHTIPWTNVYRMMLLDMDAMDTLNELMAEDEEPEAEPPAWVAEVLQAAADAVGEDDDGGSV